MQLRVKTRGSATKRSRASRHHGLPQNGRAGASAEPVRPQPYNYLPSGALTLFYTLICVTPAPSFRPADRTSFRDPPPSSPSGFGSSLAHAGYFFPMRNVGGKRSRDKTFEVSRFSWGAMGFQHGQLSSPRAGDRRVFESAYRSGQAAWFHVDRTARPRCSAHA